MNIVLVIPSLRQGGAERVMSELANHWTSKGHNVSLIVWGNEDFFYFIHPDVSLYRLNFVNRSLLSNIAQEVMICIKTRSLLRMIRPEFVLSFITVSNAITIIAAFATGLRVYVSDRFNPNKRIAFEKSLLRRCTYKWAAGVIAQTDLAKYRLKQITGNQNVETIPNPVRSIVFTEEAQKERIIINVGRLMPEKGQHYLLNVFAKLNAPGWRLVILGDGRLRPLLESEVARLGIVNHVSMPGAVKDVETWLARSSIFVFSSVSEGFPNALAEAMVSGLPCVSFDCDTGPRDLIEDGKNGYLIPVGDTDGMADRIQYLIDNPGERERLGQEAKLLGVKLNKDTIINKYLEFCSGKVKYHD